MALSSLYDDDLVFYLVRDYLIIAGVPEQFIKFDIFGNALSIAFVQDYANVDEGLDKRLSEYVKTLPIQQFRSAQSFEQFDESLLNLSQFS